MLKTPPLLSAPASFQAYGAHFLTSLNCFKRCRTQIARKADCTQEHHLFTSVMLVSPWALEQLVSLKRLTYVAYFVLATCFLVFVQNKLFYLRCVLKLKFLPSKQSNKTLGVRTVALADCSIEKYDKQFYKFISKSCRTETFMFAM